MLESGLLTQKVPRPIPAQRRKLQVLAVDDNKAVQDVLARIISHLGYEVTLAGNGLEAGALFLTKNFDLVITDLQMPLMNGWELSRLVKERSPTTPIILVTGYGDYKPWEKLNLNCIDAIIPKPFRIDDFDTTIQRLLNHGP